jgi:hypothetical protein
MKARHKPKYDLPKFTQALWRAFHHEQKEEKAGEQASQDSQKPEEHRVGDDDRTRYAATFQSREIMIVLIRLVQQNYLDITSALVKMHGVVQHDLIGATNRSEQGAFT